MRHICYTQPVGKIALLILISITNAEGASELERVHDTYLDLGMRLLQQQRPEGQWEGRIEADVTAEVMALLIQNRLGLKAPDNFLAETLDRIFSWRGDQIGWSRLPEGESQVDITGFVLHGLKACGMSDYDPRVHETWSWYLERGGSENLQMIHRSLLMIAGALPGEQIPPYTPYFMALPRLAPFSTYSVGIARAAFIPMSLWAFHHRKKPFARGEEFWARKALQWLLDHQDVDGTYAGFLHLTYLFMFALDEAERSGAGVFRPDVEKAWAGILAWRRPAPQGGVMQQVSVGPVMDTARAITALLEGPSGLPLLTREQSSRAIEWLTSVQTRLPGDWSGLAPEVSPGGWAFQYSNRHYPDTDDTAMVLEALAKLEESNIPGTRSAIIRGATWLLGIRNKDGGFPVWDRGTSRLFNFLATKAKFEAMADDSQPDVTARAIKALAALRKLNLPELGDLDFVLNEAVHFLLKSRQITVDSELPLWSGEWMANYLYGTSEAVDALLESDHWRPSDAVPYIKWLLNTRHRDGGWGESLESYSRGRYVSAPSTVSQTVFVLNVLLTFALKGGEYPLLRQTIDNAMAFLEPRIRQDAREFTIVFIKNVAYGSYLDGGLYEAVRIYGKYLKLLSTESCEYLMHSRR